MTEYNLTEDESDEGIETVTYRLGLPIRAICYASAVSLPLTGLGVHASTYLMPYKDPLTEVGFALSLFLLTGACFGLIPARWRIRVDSEGVHRRRVFRWNTWSWDDFRSGKIEANAGCVDPTKPLGRRKLNLLFLSDADQKKIADLVAPRWLIAPHHSRGEPVSCRKGIWRKEVVTFDQFGIRHLYQGRVKAYSWLDVERVRISRQSRDVHDNYRKLTFTLPDRSLTFGTEWRRPWRGERPIEILEWIRENVPEEKITEYDLGGEPQSEEERQDRLPEMRRSDRIRMAVFAGMLFAYSGLSLYVFIEILQVALENPSLPFRELVALTIICLSYLPPCLAPILVGAVYSHRESTQRIFLWDSEMPAPHTTRFRKVLYASLLSSTLVLSVILGGGVFAWVKFDSAVTQAHADIETQLSSIRAKGEPVGIVDLEAAYPEIPESENAAIVYQEAFDMLNEQHSPDDDFDLGEFLKNLDSSAPLSPDELAVTEAYLTPRFEAIQLLRKAARMERCQFPLNFADGYEMDQPYVNRLREAARLFELNAILNMEQGEVEGALEDLYDVVRIAGSITYDPTLLGQLVRIAVLQISVDGFEHFLNRGQLNRAQLVHIGTELFPQDSLARFSQSFVTERCLALLAIDTYWGEGWMTNAFDKRELLTQLNGLIEISKLSYPEAINSIEVVSERFTDTDFRFRLTRKATCAIMPVITRAVIAPVRVESLIRCLRTAAAIEQYRLDTGRISDSLDELVPLYIDSILDDPFDGIALRYKVLDPGYVVYSVGDNREDDGGVSKSEAVGENWDVTFEVNR